MNQFSGEQIQQNDKRSIREMKIVLKIIPQQDFKGFFLWFINGIQNNIEVSFFKKKKKKERKMKVEKPLG